MKLLNKAGFEPTRTHMAEVLSQCLDGTYNEPFCIIGCASPLFPDEGMCYWNLCISPEQNVDVIGEISATDAKKIIEGYGMEKVEKYGKQGFIYDNPENSFRKAWRGYFTTKELSAIWEDLCKHPDAPSIHMANPAICAFSDGDVVEITCPYEVAFFLTVLTDPSNTGTPAIRFRHFLSGRKLIFNKI